jgi:hypothetical protein
VFSPVLIGQLLSVILPPNTDFLLRRLVICLLFLLPSFSIQAQDPNYILLDKSKGLPSNCVYNIFQDSKGFIWISTEAGLCRYDGYQFKTYSNPSQTSKSGSEIHEDVFGRIWYQNFDGYLYYVENDSLHTLKQNKTAGYLPFGLSQKTLFHISEKGVDLFDLKTLQWRKTIALEKPNDFVYSLASDNLFYVCSKNISVFNDTGLVEQFPNTHNMGKMLAVSNGEIWFYTPAPSSAVARLSANQIKPFFRCPNKTFIHSTSFADDRAWFCSSSGAFAYTKQGKAAEDGRLFFSGKSISCVFKDRENNFWFCTTNEGVLFVPDLSSRRFIPEKNIRRLSLYNDLLFFGTQNGEIWNLDTSSNQPIFKSTTSHSVDFLAAGDSFYPLFFTTDSFYSASDKRILQKNSVSLKDCQPIAPGTYACAITGYAGLFFAPNSPDNDWKHLSWGKPDISPGEGTGFGYILIENVRAKSVAWDAASQTIYYATNKGLFAVTKKGAEEIKHEDKSLYIARVFFYNGVLYALSTQGDILSFRHAKFAENCNKKFGLAVGEAQNMVLREHFLLISTRSTVGCVDLNDPRGAIVFLPVFASEINDLVVWKNKLYIASSRGILSMDMALAIQKPENPLFVLTGFYVNQKAQNVLSPMLLNYGQQMIEVNYSILSFKRSGSYPLYYRINEQAWELCSPESRSLILAALSPGDYVLQFRLGDASENRPISQQVRFTIEQAWWKKWWALLFYVVVLVLVLFLIYKRQLHIQERKNKLLTEKIELEKNLNRSVLTSLKSQMNPHFFYNALNTIQSFIFENDKQNAGVYLSKFSTLTRMILEMSGKENISLREEITACTLYLELEQARFSEDFSFSLEVKGFVDLDLIRLPPMIIQPYIENAVKHGLLHKKGAKTLAVIFERADKNLMVTIDDNGIGRERSAQLNAIRQDRHKSFASEATKKRLDLLNRDRIQQLRLSYTDKHDASGQSSGTLVCIHIPI